MLIISQTPSAAGQYPPILRCSSAGIPAGYYWWPDTLERDTFYQYEGFVVLTIVRNTVASYVPNVEAYEAWKASQAPAEPTDTEVLNTLLGV